MPIKPFDTAFVLTPFLAGDQYWSHVTASGDGSFAAAWFDAASSGVQYGIGTTLNFTTLSGNVPGHPNSIAIRNLADGRYAMAWNDGGDIKAQVISAMGATPLLPFTVPIAGNARAQPILGVQSNGNFIVGFTNFSQNPDDIEARLYSGAGVDLSGSFSASRNLNGADDGQAAMAIAANDSQLYVYHSVSGGVADLRGNFVTANALSTIGNEITISDVNSRPDVADTTSSSQLALLADGRFLAAWKDAGDELHYRIINANGTFATGILSAATGILRVTGLTALLDGGFMLGWDNGNDSFIRQFGADGGASDGAQALPAIPGVIDAAPSLATLADGRVIVTWSEQSNGAGYEIRAQIYDPRTAGINISGTDGYDLYYGSAFGDVIRMNGGYDYVDAGSGNDSVFGGDGVDQIWLGSGNDYAEADAGTSSVLVGQDGNDTLYGGEGDDYMIGGEGDDLMVGIGGVNSMYGGTGDDLLIAGDGVGSVIDGGAGANQLWGGAGNDYMVGGELADLLVGGAGSDYMFGNAGDDAIYAGAGTDYIYSNAGNDFIYTDDIGVAFQDYIYVGGGTGVDTIADFTAGFGGDVLVVSPASGIGSFAQLQAAMAQVGIYTVITMSGGDQVYLYNVQPSQLTVDNVLFF